jgi:hypothetical protein
MTSDRLERAVQQMHSIGISLTSLVLAAIAADKASTSFDLGILSHYLLYASLGCFVVTAIAGGHLITRLPLMDGDVEEVLTRPAPLIGGKQKGLFAFSVGVWRQIQHWGLIVAIVLGVLGALVTATADEVDKPAPAAASAAKTAS